MGARSIHPAAADEEGDQKCCRARQSASGGGTVSIDGELTVEPRDTRFLAMRTARSGREESAQAAGVSGLSHSLSGKGKQSDGERRR